MYVARMYPGRNATQSEHPSCWRAARHRGRSPHPPARAPASADLALELTITAPREVTIWRGPRRALSRRRDPPLTAIATARATRTGPAAQKHPEGPQGLKLKFCSALQPRTEGQGRTGRTPNKRGACPPPFPALLYPQLSRHPARGGAGFAAAAAEQAAAPPGAPVPALPGHAAPLCAYYATVTRDRKSTRLNSSHSGESRMPSSA